MNEYLALGVPPVIEHGVLKFIGENKTSKEIADPQFVGVKIVHNHRTNICAKLNLHGINTLLKFAIEHRPYL